MDFNFKALIRTVAPTLATALGGPLAGSAVRLIAETLLGKPEATEAEIEQALERASPEDLLKLKDAEANFKARMKELDIKRESLAYADTSDARELAERTSIWPQYSVIMVYQIAFFITLGWLISKLWAPEAASISPAVLSLVSGFLGVLLGELPRQMSWMFGSSQGSKEKTKALTSAMNEAVRQAQVAQEQTGVTKALATSAAITNKDSQLLPQPPHKQSPAPVSVAKPSKKPDFMN